MLSQSFVNGFEKQALWKELALSGSLLASPVAKGFTAAEKGAYSAGKAVYKQLKNERTRDALTKAKDSPRLFKPGAGGSSGGLSEQVAQSEAKKNTVHDTYHKYKDLEKTHDFKIRGNHLSKGVGNFKVSTNPKLSDLGLSYKHFSAKLDKGGRVKNIGANVTDNLRVEAHPQSKGVSAMWSTSF